MPFRQTAALLLLAFAAAAHAAFPEKPIRLVIGFPACGRLRVSAKVAATGVSRSCTARTTSSGPSACRIR